MSAQDIYKHSHLHQHSTNEVANGNSNEACIWPLLEKETILHKINMEQTKFGLLANPYLKKLGLTVCISRYLILDA